MKMLSNPWEKIPGYNCFGCSPDNPIGLRMKFTTEGDYVVCDWEPGDNHQGFINILHGGIQSSLMDEIASWAVFVMAEKAGVTSRLEVRFRKPVQISKGLIRLRASIKESGKRLVRVYVELLDGEGTLCSEAMADYFIVRDYGAEDKIRFPGKQAFFQ